MTFLRNAGENEEEMSSPMCALEELKREEERAHRLIMLIFGLFVILVLLSTYMITRLLAIVCQRFRHECKFDYFPMLMLLFMFSTVNTLFQVASFFLPFVPRHQESPFQWHAILWPVGYSLVMPSEIALADVILCLQRIYLHKSGKISKNRSVESVNWNKWMGVIVFFCLFGPVAFFSFIAQRYTANFSENRNTFMFVCFLIDVLFKIICSISSFVGYFVIYLGTKRYDSIIYQAMPIAGFQLITITAQCLLELPVLPTEFTPDERIFLHLCFSAASSVAVPLCIMLGESNKRRLFYKSLCCFYCYCTPKSSSPKPVRERNSRADRQKAENEQAIKERNREREERRRRNRENNMDINFYNIRETESQESVV